MNCEICNGRAFQKHHIISKCFGGNNKPENTCMLCANCHTLVHKDEIVLEGRFMTTEGYKLIFHKKEEASITGIEASNNVYLM